MGSPARPLTANPTGTMMRGRDASSPNAQGGVSLVRRDDVETGFDARAVRHQESDDHLLADVELATRMHEHQVLSARRELDFAADRDLQPVHPAHPPGVAVDPRFLQRRRYRCPGRIPFRLLERCK
jgi:hypothetical protein